MKPTLFLFFECHPHLIANRVVTADIISVYNMNRGQWMCALGLTSCPPCHQSVVSHGITNLLKMHVFVSPTNKTLSLKTTIRSDLLCRYYIFYEFLYIPRQTLHLFSMELFHVFKNALVRFTNQRPLIVTQNCWKHNSSHRGY